MRRDTFLAFAAILCLLAAMAAKSLFVDAPALRTHNAPGQFDAAAAKARLARILGEQRPHPADSEADDAVRARLVAELRAIGLQPIVRDQNACNDFAKARLIACTRVRNVIARFGPPAGRALLLSAHYDSVPVGPGAGDDGVGVATLLEVGAILKDRPLKKPIILLFNEGEELGLIGARAFLADPISANVDSLLNFEARGVTGPVTMFETSQPNGPAIAAFSRAVARPYASSLSADVARLIPNDTDVTTYKERGWLTLNFAMTGNETRYHSPGDDIAGLDIRTLQDMGDQALAVSSELAMASQPSAQGQQLFVDVLRVGLWRMPQWLGAAILAVLLLLTSGVAWKRRALFRAPAIALGAIVLGVVAASLAVTVMGLLVAGTYWRAHPLFAFTATYATIILGALAVLLPLGAKLGAARLRVGFWFLFLLIGAGLAFVAPGAMIYFLLPPALVLLGILAARRSSSLETAGALSGLAALYVIWGELLIGLESIFSPGPLWIVAPAGAIVIVPALVEVLQLFERPRRRVMLLGSAVIALLAWVIAGTVPAYSQDHQQRFTIEYDSDAAAHRSYWSIASDGAALPESYARIARWRQDKLPFSERKRWIADAPTLPAILPPSLELLQAVRHGSNRTLRLRLKMNGAERLVLIAPPEAHIRAAGVAGFLRRAGESASEGKFTITCTGRTCDGADLQIDLGSLRPVELMMIGARNGLPPIGAPLLAARPPFARPQYTPDQTVAFTRVAL
jgi:hypothetical protein